MSDKPNTTTLPDGWRLFDKYQIRHTDGTPLKGKRYFVLRLDTDDPAEAARVEAAMSAYKGETQGNAAKVREAASYLASIFDCDIKFLETHAKELRDTGAYGGGIIEHILHSITLAKEALAAPARNCDVGTAEEQAKRYARHCDAYLRDDGGKPCTNCPCCGKIPYGRCEFAWAQLPYESEVAK